jgi:hypothetical protein
VIRNNEGGKEEKEKIINNGEEVYCQVIIEGRNYMKDTILSKNK